MAYLDRKTGWTLNTGGLGFAIALNGGVFAALIFAAPHVVPDVMVNLQGYEVKPDPAPLPPAEQEKKSPPPPARPTAPPDRELVIPLSDPFPVQPLIFTPAPLGAGSGEGAGLVERKVEPDSTPARTPVVTGAKPDPRHAGLLQPPYPTSMIRAGLGGLVVVRVLVGSDGRVKAVEQVSATEEAFFRATRDQALSKWRFKPATSDGKAIESWREMTVRFVLPD